MLGAAAGVVSNNTDRRRIYRCHLATDKHARSCRGGVDWDGWIVRGRVMRSMKDLRVVVVTDSEHGHVLAARLRRMEVAHVMAVAGLEEARLLCQSGRADACLVAVGAPVPDAPPMKESDAPGLCCGVPASTAELPS